MLVQPSKGLEVLSAWQLELQGAVELEQALPMGDSPLGKKGAS